MFILTKSPTPCHLFPFSVDLALIPPDDPLHEQMGRITNICAYAESDIYTFLIQGLLSILFAIAGKSEILSWYKEVD